jgi:hypothetical protein
MNNILVATIEHSGTFAVLTELGWKLGGGGVQVVPFAERARASDGDILHAHLFDRYIDDILAYAVDHKVIVTTRPYADLVASWKSREKDYPTRPHSDLDSQIANYDRVLALGPRVLQLDRNDVTQVISVGRLWA